MTITSHVNVMGILAQFGRGMIQDVSDQMFDTFVAAVRAELETARDFATRPRAPSGGAHAREPAPNAPATARRMLQRAVG